MPIYGGEWREEGHEDPEYGFVGTLVLVLDPSEVRAAAEFLRGVGIEKSMRDLETVLVQMMDKRGLSPWDARWAAEVSTDLVRLRQFYIGGTEAGDAAVKWQWA